MSYTIKQVSERVGITIPTLRYYDREGLLPFINRKDNGTRVFEEADFGGLEVISCMKKSGVSIKDIRKYMELCDVGDSTLEQRRAIFFERKRDVLEQMAELKTILATIEHKIDYYNLAIEAGTEAVHKQKRKSQTIDLVNK